MSDYRQSLLEVSLRGHLSLADAIILVHRLGQSNAARFIGVVDPWCYPGEKLRASCLVQRFLQGAVDSATNCRKGLRFMDRKNNGGISPLTTSRAEGKKT